MDKKIEEMDGSEFIAHVFYDVLGGLHANEEIDARLGILDMIDDFKKSVVEKNERIKALEAENDYLKKNSYTILREENESLKNRVEELEAKDKIRIFPVDMSQLQSQLAEAVGIIDSSIFTLSAYGDKDDFLKAKAFLEKVKKINKRL